jgi:hypothetical protein
MLESCCAGVARAMQPTLAESGTLAELRHPAISDLRECEGRLSSSTSAIITAFVGTMKKTPKQLAITHAGEHSV